MLRRALLKKAAHLDERRQQLPVLRPLQDLAHGRDAGARAIGARAMSGEGRSAGEGGKGRSAGEGSKGRSTGEGSKSRSAGEGSLVNPRFLLNAAFVNPTAAL